MKIIFLCEAVFPENRGGVERWFQRLSSELAQRGHDVVYINATQVDEVRNGVKYVSITEKPWTYLTGGVRSKKQALHFAIRSGKYLWKSDSDAVYATSVPILSVFPVLLVQILKRKTVTFVEWFEIWPLNYWLRYSGIFSGALGWLLQFLALQIGRYRVTYTYRAWVSARNQSWTGRRKKIKLLPGLCSPNLLNEIDTTSTRTDLVFLGRFVDEKQPLLAMQAAEELRSLGWNGKLWVIGKGPRLNEMKRFLDEKPFRNEYVKIVPDASDQVVNEKLLASFALLHPSKREGYGLASIEAAYLGTPSLLINYSNNATVDLQISPKLLVREDVPIKIAERLYFAYNNQDSLRAEVLEWARVASIEKSWRNTLEDIERLAANKK